MIQSGICLTMKQHINFGMMKLLCGDMILVKVVEFEQFSNIVNCSVGH